MSIRLIQQAWESPLKGNDLLILISLADNASDEGYCFPSWQTIMKKTKVSKGTLSSVLNRLEKNGYIARESRKRESGSDASNGYFILQNKQSSRFEHHKNKGQSSKVEHHNEEGWCSEVEHGGVQKLNTQSSKVEHLYEPSCNRQLEPSVIPHNPPSEICETEIVESDAIPFSEIIDHLNQVAGTNYRSNSDKTKALIKARWDEGYRLDHFKHVHIVKFDEWVNNEKMAKFIRPETLYSNKFEGYCNQAPSKRLQGQNLQEAMNEAGYSNFFDFLSDMDAQNNKVGMIA